MTTLAASESIDAGALDELQASLRGELVRPEDPQYEEHRRVWNGSIDRHPALVARCTGVADVLAAVRFARPSGASSRPSGAAGTASRASPCATAGS